MTLLQRHLSAPPRLSSPSDLGVDAKRPRQITSMCQPDTSDVMNEKDRERERDRESKGERERERWREAERERGEI